MVKNFILKAMYLITYYICISSGFIYKFDDTVFYKAQ